MAKINTKECVSCGACFEVCLQDAIQFYKHKGQKYAQAYVEQEKCIKCGKCLQVSCPADAISE